MSECQHICPPSSFVSFHQYQHTQPDNVHRVHAGSRCTTLRSAPCCTGQGSSIATGYGVQSSQVAGPWKYSRRMRACSTPSDPISRQPCPLICFQATSAVAPGLQDVARRGSLEAHQLARSSTGHCFLCVSIWASMHTSAIPPWDTMAEADRAGTGCKPTNLSMAATKGSCAVRLPIAPLGPLILQGDAHVHRENWNCGTTSPFASEVFRNKMAHERPSPALPSML